MNKLVVAAALSIYAHTVCLAQDVSLIESVRELIDAGEFEQAEGDLERLLEQAPESAELHYLFGLTLNQRVGEVSLLRKLGYARRGRQALEKAIYLDPSFAPAWKELSDYYYYAPAIGGGDKGKASEMLESVRAHDEALYWQTLAERAMNEGRTEESIDHYLKVLEISPDNAQVYVQIGILYELNNQPQQARMSYETALENNPGLDVARENLEALYQD